MLYTIIFIAVLIFWMDRLHCLRISTIVFENQSRLFEIRDHLREGVLNGRVDPRNWVFLYLDSTLTKTIDILDRLTIWRIIGFALSGGGETAVDKSLAALHRELEKPGNAYLKDVDQMFMGILTLYLFERHSIIKLVAHGLVRIAQGKQYIARKAAALTRITASAQETSTLREFAPAG